MRRTTDQSFVGSTGITLGEGMNVAWMSMRKTRERRCRDQLHDNVKTDTSGNIRCASTPDAHVCIPHRLIHHTKSLYSCRCSFVLSKAQVSPHGLDSSLGKCLSVPYQTDGYLRRWRVGGGSLSIHSHLLDLIVFAKVLMSASI